jgi:phage terminase small subunit
MIKKPKPPEALSPGGRKLWKAILGDWPIHDAAHLAVLRVGLESLDRAARCRAIIDREGELSKDRFGQSKPHPLLSAERDARSSFFQAVKVLGLDPSDIEV